MSYLDEVKEKEAKISLFLEQEETNLFLNLVKRSDFVKEVLAFQYEELDTLTLSRMEKFLGALNQYSIYVAKYINNFEARRKVAKAVYDRKLSIAIFKYSEKAKSMTEKEMVAQENDKELFDILDHIQEIEAKLALYNNIPDKLESLIQTIKKVYDAKRTERITQ